jgi:hypothetical protein
MDGSRRGNGWLQSRIVLALPDELVPSENTSDEDKQRRTEALEDSRPRFRFLEPQREITNRSLKQRKHGGILSDAPFATLRNFGAESRLAPKLVDRELFR